MKYDIESIEKRKKNEKIFRNILKIILIILLYNIILLGISTMDNNEGSGICGLKSYIITTSSMEPDIKTGDVVICQKTDAKDLKEGDVITFNKNGEVITHRIIKIETNDEINYYITKGDNNTLEDNEKVDDIWRDWVPEMSYDLMDSYDTIQLDPDDYENDEEFWEAMEEERNANVDGYVIPIKADVTLSVDGLKKIAFQLGADSFQEEYCERC